MRRKGGALGAPCYDYASPARAWQVYQSPNKDTTFMGHPTPCTMQCKSRCGPVLHDLVPGPISAPSLPCRLGQVATKTTALSTDLHRWQLAAARVLRVGSPQTPQHQSPDKRGENGPTRSDLGGFPPPFPFFCFFLWRAGWLTSLPRPLQGSFLWMGCHTHSRHPHNAWTRKRGDRFCVSAFLV